MKFLAQYRPSGSPPPAQAEGFDQAGEVIPVVAQINDFLTWYGALLWYEKIGVAVGIMFGIWLFAKIVGMIFSTGGD